MRGVNTGKSICPAPACRQRARRSRPPLPCLFLFCLFIYFDVHTHTYADDPSRGVRAEREKEGGMYKCLLPARIVQYTSSSQTEDSLVIAFSNSFLSFFPRASYRRVCSPLVHICIVTILIYPPPSQVPSGYRIRHVLYMRPARR